MRANPGPGRGPPPARRPALCRGFDATLAGIGCAAYDRTIDGWRRNQAESEHTAALPRRPHSMLEVQPTVVSLSDAAASKLRELTAEETNPAIGLRVYVYSGG